MFLQHNDYANKDMFVFEVI